jgi:hypothetical protein
VLDRRSFLLVLVASVAATVVLASVIVSRDSSEPLSPSEYRVELRDALAGKFRSAGERLADVEPPADAARAHARLVAGLRSYGAWLNELAGSGRAGAVEFETQLAEHQLAGKEWIEAFNELASKGYLSSPAP